MAEWDASTYHRVADPQFAWGQSVLDRARLRGCERVMDAGCGSGRLTAEIARRVPEGHVVAVDVSMSMLREARRHLATLPGARVHLVRADLLDLPFYQAVDLVFSTAAFHWVLDHDRLFRNLFLALRPGGRLVAQCGGGPNLDRVHARAARLMAEPPFAPFFEGWRRPWEFPGAATSAERLRQAGFVKVETWLAEAPISLSDRRAYETFLATVVLRLHLKRLPDEALRKSFLAQLADEVQAEHGSLLLDYWRLNIDATKPDRPA